MSPPHWLHCNECFFVPDKTNRRFWMTNCSHLYCEKCVTLCTKEKRCKLCKAKCETLQLNAKIPKTVQDMFSDPLDCLKKDMTKFQQRLDFHSSQHRRLTKHLVGKVKAQDAQMAQAKKMYSHMKNMEKEMIKMKKENQYLQSLVNNKRDGSPSSRMREAQRQKKPSVPPSPFGGGSSSTPKTGAPYSSMCTPPYSMSRNGPHGMNSQQYNASGSRGMNSQSYNRPGYNISSSRLIVRSPPEGGKMGSVSDFSLTPDNLRPNNLRTPDSGFSSDQLSDPESTPPLSIPRPIHFGSDCSQ